MEKHDRKAYEYKINELSPIQKGHLAWRLDARTACGYITANNIARGKGEYGEMTLMEVFKLFIESDQSAKIHSKKVVEFKL